MEERKPRPEIKARLSTFANQHEFDREFWREAGPSARLNAAAEMVDEYYWIKGLSGDATVFQRTIGHLKRKTG